MTILRTSFIILLMVSSISPFNFPNIGDFFTNLGKKLNVEEPIESRDKRQTSIGDELAGDPWKVKSSGIPTKNGKVNKRHMPTLGNGHIGLTVFDDSLYLEGLYTGSGAATHRAKIPALIMTRAYLSDPELEGRNTRKYQFDAKYGIFQETVITDFAEVEHRMYVHQKFMRVFVVDVKAQKRATSQSTGGGVINFKYPGLNSTSDIVFDTPRRYNANWQVSGTVTSEGIQKRVHIFWMEVISQMAIRGVGSVPPMTLIMAVDWNEGDARSEFQQAVEIVNTRGTDLLLQEHKATWNRVWNEGRVEVVGNQYVAKIANFAQYYLLSSMPALFPAQGLQHDQIYHGVGRSSLGKGALGQDYQGHIMWDNEMYILPAMLLFHPLTVRRVLAYRTGTAAKAEENAKKYQGVGYHYPFQSAFTGDETSPDVESCPECAWRKLHTTGAVAWAFRQYYSATRDVDFRNNPLYSGCDVTREIARFFANRAVYNPEHGRYDLKGVTGPDETYTNVNNNAYTVVLASLAIHWARYFACLCQRNEREEVPDDWIHRATLLNLPFDNVKRTHASHEGYDLEADNGQSSQADTILLTFPLHWNMSEDIMKNDLDYYETLTSKDTPAMTHSFFTVGWKMVKEDLKMQAFFQQSYQDYVVEPFKIWTEYKEGYGTLRPDSESAVNFLPGMGGFLQSLVYGFGGVRIRPQMLEFHDPQPPPGSSELRLYGLKYLNSSMNIIIRQSGDISITVVHENTAFPLVLQLNDTQRTEISLRFGTSETFMNSGNGFYIYTNAIEGCEHPRDYIYMPWGYSPFVDDSNTLTPNSVLIISIFLVFVGLRKLS